MLIPSQSGGENQDQNPITPTQDVTVDLNGGLFDSVTFGANLGVTNTSILSDTEYDITIATDISNGTRREFSIRTNYSGFSPNSNPMTLGTLSDGNTVQYKYVEDQDMYPYMFKYGDYYYTILSYGHAYTLQEMQMTIDNLLLIESTSNPIIGNEITLNTDNGPVSGITFMSELGLANATIIDQSEQYNPFSLEFAETNYRGTLSFEVKGSNIYVDDMSIFDSPLGTLSNGVTVYYKGIGNGEGTTTYLYVWEQDGVYAYYGDGYSNTLMTIEKMQSFIDSISVTIRYTELKPEGVEQVVTVEGDDTFISTVTFGADLLIDRADCLQADSSIIQIDAHFDGEEYDRSIMFSTSELTYDSESMGTTQDGVDVTYKDNSGVNVYGWQIEDEVNYQTIYIEMHTSTSLTLEDIGFIIANMTIETKSRY